MSAAETGRGAKPIPALLTLSVGVLLWFLPHPAELTTQTWHLFAIFVSTIAGIILRPLPVGPVVLIGMVTSALTGTLTPSEVFSAFARYQLWLIAVAFFIANGLIKTRLAERLSYHFLRLLGKSSLGVAYGLLFGEFAMAPFIPSLAARSGGILFPIVMALSHDFDLAYPNQKIERLKGFFTLTAFQGAAVCSGLFLTSMAANPIMVDAAAQQGITMTWTSWAIASCVPGAVSLLALPWFLNKLMKPELKETPNAPAMAQRKLEEMGAMSRDEKLMLGTLLFVLLLWVIGPWIGVNSTIAALTGLSLLLIFGVVTWRDCMEQTTAWDALFWLAGIVAMGNHLKEFGFFDWFSSQMGHLVGPLGWMEGFLLLSIGYFYSHYLFASNTAHVSAMYAAFLGTALAIGTPPLLAAFLLAFFSNLFGGLTHYSSGPAPIYYSARFVTLRRWWGVGFVVSLLNITIWVVIGGAWWRLIGLW